jgi:periplasmic protein TonB
MMKGLRGKMSLFLFVSALLLLTKTNAQSISKDTADAVFTVVEQPATYPGGEQAMGDFIRKIIKYPKKEKKEGIDGIAYVTFVVEKDGSVSNVKLLRGIPGKPKCNQEAVRVVKKMPKWNPGYQNGKAVRVQFNLPIRFRTR